MSFVNHQFKNAFIHIPKSAGTSMLRAPFVAGGRVISRKRSEVHRAVHELEFPSDYWKWSFVRNPFDRLLSFHTWIAKTQKMRNTRNFNHIPLDFSEFVLKLPEIHDGRLGRYRWVHSAPQTYFVCHPHSREIAVDFVGKYENLDEDWERVCLRFIGERFDIPIINQAKYKPNLLEAYSEPVTREAVAEFYRDDFELFGYSTDLAEGL